MCRPHMTGNEREHRKERGGEKRRDPGRGFPKFEIRTRGIGNSLIIGFFYYAKVVEGRLPLRNPGECV